MASHNTPTNSAQLGGTEWVKITIPLTCISVGFVACRVFWRIKMLGRIGWPDACIIGAALMAITQEVVGCVGILRYGLGHHGKFLGIYRMRKALMFFYIYQIPYKVLVTLTKMSFLFLYLDVFTIPWFQKVVWGVNISVIAAGIAFTLTTIFQCHPIELNWDKSIGHGYCIDAPVFWYAHAGWNTAFDIIVLLLPVPVIRSLQMPKHQKAALFAVFALGAFVVVTSIMRMVTLDIAAKSTVTDLTYATGKAFTWTQVESDVGIICACLPMLKALLARYFPTLFGKAKTTNNSSSNAAYKLSYVHENSNTQRRTWDNNKNYRSHVDADDSSSQEEIFGIQKTVNVSVSAQDKGLESPRPMYDRRREDHGQFTRYPIREQV